MDKIKRIEEIMDSEDFGWADKYKEPGYKLDEGKMGIVTANWNNIDQDLIDEIEDNFNIEWSDEWIKCCDCGGLLRTIPNSYSWQRSFIEFEGDIVCLDCMEDWIKEYFESLENNPRAALTRHIIDHYNPEDYGYKLQESGFENGLHEGMNDNPMIILRSLQAEGFKHILFAISDSSQFYLTFQIYTENDLYDEWYDLQ